MKNHNFRVFSRFCSFFFTSCSFLLSGSWKVVKVTENCIFSQFQRHICFIFFCDPTRVCNTQVNCLKSWKILSFFYRDKHALLAWMSTGGQIDFFLIWAGTTSSRAMKVIRASKNWIFSKFCESLISCRFWPLLTRFWLTNTQGAFVIFYEFSNPYLAFPTQNWVKSGQNRQKIKHSKNWEKIQFFDTQTTFIALELDSPASIKNCHFQLFSIFSLFKTLLPIRWW